VIAAETVHLQRSDKAFERSLKPHVPSDASSGRTLRVLHVIHGLQRGGLENGVINLVNRLPREQFAQSICCLDRRGELADRIAGDVPIHVLDRGRYDLRLPLRLARLLRELQPDVVHCRNWNTWMDTAAAHRLASRHGPLVWSFHGFADGEWFPWRRRVASRMLARMTDHLLAVCQDSAARYADRTGIPGDRFGVVYNGVDTARFAPASDRAQARAALGFANEEILVLTVASLTPVKDHAGLIDAIEGLLLPANARVRFLFLGDGALRQALEARIAERGLQERVLLLGNSDQVSEYLSMADFLVLPSRLEGMSNAILEAMASGLPVVARRVGGNPELVVDGETGLLTRPGDVDDLTTARCLSGVCAFISRTAATRSVVSSRFSGMDAPSRSARSTFFSFRRLSSGSARAASSSDTAP
jgi:glycosyltransferase involved in cell wall biosynthesis